MATRVLSTVCCSDDSNGGYTISISNDGFVYSFGKHSELGHGHLSNKVLLPKIIDSVMNVKSISCGSGHSVCLDTFGNVYSFGESQYGQLGDPKIEISTNVRQINLPTIKQISCGYYFTMCLSEEGDLYSFGCGSGGYLGIGSSEGGSSPQKVPLNNVQFVECGGFHTVCKTMDDCIYSWGCNDYGQLGIPEYGTKYYPFKCTNWPENVVDIKCGYYHTLILTSTQEVYSCGKNQQNQLGRITGNFELPVKIEDFSEIIRIECGNYYSMLIDIHHNLYVFGTIGRYNPGEYQVMVKPKKLPILSNIADISSGGWHTFAKTFSNEIFAFGDNRYSQFGIQTTNVNILTPIQVLQDKEDIWYSNTNKSKAKSARFVI